jgi:CDP-glucose 4,6-dehydratase
MLSTLSTYSGKRVLVTGHTGFKGAWLSRWLLALGAEVTGYSKNIPTSPSLFESLGLAGELRDVRADIRDQEFLERQLRAVRPDLVFHLAAQSLVRASYEDPLNTFHENTFGTAQVLEAVRRTKQIGGLVVITTDKVYENADQGTFFREEDPLGGHDPYSASKAATEIIVTSYVRSFFASGTRLASARAGNVIGGGDWATDRLVPDCVRAWAKGSVAKIRNPAHQRPWQFVLEPLYGYLLLGARLLEAPAGTHGESFNFGPDASEERSVGQMVEAMAALWPGAEVRLGAPEDGSREASSLRLDCSKTRERLGWRPILSLDEAVAWTLEWYRLHAAGDPALREFTLGQIREYQGRIGL